MTAFVQLALDWLGGQSIQEEPLPLPASNASKAFSASAFVHPLASRQIQLQQTTIAYAFQRVKRKTIGMSVGADGLEVRAPRWATVASVEAVLHEKSDWILRKLQESQERQKQMRHTIIEWRDGASLPFLGEQWVVRLDPEHQSPHISDLGTTPKCLQVPLSLHAQPGQIRDAVQAWLMQQAKLNFTERLDHFAPQLGVQWKRLSLSNAIKTTRLKRSLNFSPRHVSATSRRRRPNRCGCVFAKEMCLARFGRQTVHLCRSTPNAAYNR